MRIIKKIKIENFRSFLGTRKDDIAEVVNTTDLNIFSGSNDSGKSNVLRALNLFFNDEISRKEAFSIEKDLNINKRNTGNRVVKIRIFFDISWDEKRDKFLPSTFSISKFYNFNGFRNYLYEFKLQNIENPIRIDSRVENNKNVYTLFLPDNYESLVDAEQKKAEVSAKKREWNYRVKFSGFLNKSISFQYVPAIKDASFFSYLYGKTILLILTNEEKQIEELEKRKNAIEKWESTISKKSTKSEFKKQLRSKRWRQEKINEITEKIQITSKLKNSINSLESEINLFSNSLFSSTSFLVSEFKVGSNLREFFESFDIGTGNEKNISLKLRGDGIQAMFIPQILNFLDSIYKEKKYFLWGFEEPENSSEYKNQQKLAENLKNSFSKEKQIFITTHSEEFLSKYDGVDIDKENRRANLYHVKKISNKKYDEFSTISLFDVEKQIFEFGTTKSEIEQDIGSSLVRAKYSKELKEKEDAFLREKSALEKQNSPILYVEGELEEKILKKILIGNTNFEIKSADCADGIAKNIIGKSFLNIQHNVLGLFDHDSGGKSAIQKIKDKRYVNTKVKNVYIQPNSRLIEIIQKQGIEYSFDELLPDFIWKHLYEHDFLENADKFNRLEIPRDKTLNNYLSEKFLDDSIAILKVSKKVKRIRKNDFQDYLLSLNSTKLTEISISLQPTLNAIREFFNNGITS